MKRLALSFFVFVFLSITASVFSQTIYERGVNEDTYDWALFSNEFTSFDEIINDLAGKSDDQYYILDLEFLRQETIGVGHYLYFSFNPDNVFLFRAGRVPFTRGNKIRVWFVFQKAIFGDHYNIGIVKLEKL